MRLQANQRPRTATSDLAGIGGQGNAAARLAEATRRALASVVRSLRRPTAGGTPAAPRDAVQALESRVLFSDGFQTAAGGFYCPNNFPPVPHCNCEPQEVAETPLSGGMQTRLKYTGISGGGVRYLDGQPDVTGADLLSDGFGRTFGSQRSFSLAPVTGPMGNHWTLTDMPFLIKGPGSDPTHPSGATTTIEVITDGMDSRYFDLFGTTWVPRDGGPDTLVPGTITVGGTVYNTLTLNDSTGGKTQFYDLAGTSNDGQFIGATDADGNTTTVTLTNGNGAISRIQRSNAAGTAVEQWDFSYPTGSSLISGVTLSRSTNSGSSFTPVRQVAYAYYDGTTNGGNAGDLQSATIKDPAGHVIDTTVYRYWKSSEYAMVGTTSTLQPQGAIKAVFGTEANARALSGGYDPATATDAQLTAYADNQYVYNGSTAADGLPEVYQSVVAGAGAGSSTSGTGQGTYTYKYFTNTSGTGYNSYRYETDETLQDGTTNSVYTNTYGEVMLTAHKDGSNVWVKANQFDGAGRLVLQADPSAVTASSTTLSGQPLLLQDVNLGVNGGTYYYLNSTGPEHLTSYYTATTPGLSLSAAGGVAGYEQYTWVQHGYADNQLSVSSLTSSTVGSVTTATATVANSYAVGNVVVVSGATPSVYDGPVVVTAANSTSFSYVLPSNPGTSASGTITADRPALQDAYTYFAQSQVVGGATTATIYPVASHKVYRNADQSGPETTSYAYTFPSGSIHMTSQAVSLPVVTDGTGGTTNENGPGTADVTTTFYDGYGFPQWVKDPDNYVSFTARDAGTAKVTKSITDVDYSLLTSAEQGLFPSGWSHPSGGQHLVTTDVVDGMGRTKEETSPLRNANSSAGNQTYYVYNDAYNSTTGFTHEIRVYRGWNPTTSTTTGPIQVVHEYLPASGSHGVVYTETLTSSTAPSVTSGAPDGTETTIGASNIQSLSRSLTNNSNQVTETDDYFSLGGTSYSTSSFQLGTGSNDSSTGNYHATLYGYDGRGRQNHVKAPTGTVTDTVFDSLDRVTSTWVGTGDTGASDSDPSAGGTNSMLQVEADQYDGGGVGDSDLTQVTDSPGGSAADRVTDNYYDWRDRLVAVKEGAQSAGTETSASPLVHRPIYYYTLDNLGEVKQTDVYDGDGVTVSSSGGVPVAPSSSLRRAESINNFDEQGRVYRTTVFPVDPSTGGVGSDGLAANTYYNHRGDVVEIAPPGGPVTKYVINGAGWTTAAYTTDGASGTGWSHASGVTGDNVLRQITNTIDKDGNVTQTADAQRDSDYASTNALAANTTNHQDRVSYTGNWYDLADRLTATEDVGTDAGTAWTRPSSPDTRSDTSLVTSYGYLADNVQTVKVTGAPTGGTFTLNFGTHTTSALAYNASAATVQSALAAVTGVGSGNVAVTSPAPWTYSVRFMGSLAGAYQTPITLGTNSLTGGTSPSVTAAETIPGGDDGTVHSTTDPRGIVAFTDTDLLGRTTATISAFSAGAPASSTDQTTAYTYDGDDQTLTQTAVMPTGTPNQTTAYVYGVTATGGTTVNSNDLLAKVEYPTKTGTAAGQPSTAASDDVSYTYNRLGDVLSRTDQNQTVHTFGYDVLGRQTSDAVAVASGNPQGLDLSVLDRTTAYDGQGNAYQFTAYNTASPTIGTTTPVSQVQDSFNGLGQLTARYQSLSGAAVTTGPTPTPSVQYTYAGPSSTQNYSRVTFLTDPNGRKVHYVYNSGIDDAVSRVSTIADDDGSGGVGGHLADYSYLGPSTVVTEAAGNGNSLTYLQQANDTTNAIQSGDPRYGGDEYTGLDRFGRVVDQNYVATGTGTSTTAPTSTDRFQSGYDESSNVLFRANLVNSAFSELYHQNSTASGDNNSTTTGYDALNRLNTFARGTLSSSGHNGPTTSTYGYDTLGTANSLAGHSASWSLDALGNWSSSTTDTTTTTRANDSRNEQTTVGSATLGFDSSGNTTTDEQGRKLIYTAFGDVAEVVNPTTNYAEVYTTDALGERTSQQNTARTDAGPVLGVNNGSPQRSMVDSLTVIFPAPVSLTAGAFTLTQTTPTPTPTTTPSYSNPSGDQRTWVIALSGTGGSLADGVYDLKLIYGDVTPLGGSIGITADRTWEFHRLFGDVNGDRTVNAADQTVMNAAFGSSTGGTGWEPALDYNASGTINALDLAQFNSRFNAHTTYTVTNTSPILVGASTTAPAGQTDISAWATGNTVNLYNDAAGRVVEERQAGSTGAFKQFVWGLPYVNDLLEQDTATAVDSGGNLPTTHLLRYSLDTSFNSTGTLIGPSGSYDGVAIQPADNKVVVAGVSGSNLIVTRYFANGTTDTNFGTAGTVTLAETSPTFCRLALDASGNIVVVVDNSGSGTSSFQVSRLTPAGALDTTFNTTGQATVTFATGVVPQGIAIQSDGKIDVVGDSTSGTGIYLARLTTTGALDSSFGSSGTVSAPLSGAPSGLSIALDSSGKILVGGSDGGDVSVVRFTSAGALDTSFNTTGEAKANFGATDTAYAVSPGPNGTVVAAGTSLSGTTSNHALARFTASGSLDSTFGTSGEVLGSGGTGVIRAMLVEPNGSILAGGDANGTTAQKVWKFTASGSADTEFASGGSITANSGATVYGWAITSGPTQRVVVAGSYGGSAALAAFAPASLRLYAQHDTNYDVTALADANGTVQERFVYDPYGLVQVLSSQWTVSSDSFGAEYLYQGMRYDPATGLYHTLNREYSPTLGRWLQQDPAGYCDGADTFVFVSGGPTRFVDPSGLSQTPAHAPAAPSTSSSNWGNLANQFVLSALIATSNLQLPGAPGPSGPGAAPPPQPSAFGGHWYGGDEPTGNVRTVTIGPSKPEFQWLLASARIDVVCGHHTAVVHEEQYSRNVQLYQSEYEVQDVNYNHDIGEGLEYAGWFATCGGGLRNINPKSFNPLLFAGLLEVAAGKSMQKYADANTLPNRWFPYGTDYYLASAWVKTGVTRDRTFALD